MENLLAIPETGIVTKTWTSGLSSYTQANCQVSLTDNGYRIYSPPNLTTANDGNTMWGGFVIKPFNIDSNILQKYHTYIIKFHIKGQSSNSAGFYWSNQVGWGGGGLTPSPSNVSSSGISSNFNGECDCFYKWTINDDVRKVCTTSYSSFVQGTEYISYRDFKFGFEYTSTGSLGTDLYITDLRMYDITSLNQSKANKSGIFQNSSIYQQDNNFRLSFEGEVLAKDFYEI